MWCQSCGSELPADARFCPSCGRAAAPQYGKRTEPSGTLAAVVAAVLLVAGLVVAMIVVLMLRDDAGGEAGGDDVPPGASLESPDAAGSADSERVGDDRGTDEADRSEDRQGGNGARDGNGGGAPIPTVSVAAVAVDPASADTVLITIDLVIDGQGPDPVEYTLDMSILSGNLVIPGVSGRPLGFRAVRSGEVGNQRVEEFFEHGIFPPGGGVYRARVTVSAGDTQDEATTDDFPVDNLTGLDLEGRWSSSLGTTMDVTTTWGPEPLPTYTWIGETGVPEGTMGFFAPWDFATYWGPHSGELGTTAHIIELAEDYRPSHIRTDTGVTFQR